MLEIGNSLVVQYLQEALEYLPILKAYHGKSVGDLIPVIFTLYARYRNATLAFDGEGHVTGYSEPSGGGDPVLKALHILSVKSLQDESVCRDIRTLWDAIKTARFGEQPSHEAFPYVMCSYLVSSPSVCRYSQADEGVIGVVTEYLEGKSAERIYEETGRFGLIGDRCEKWEEYSAHIRDPRERFVYQFVRTLCGESEIRYPSCSLLKKGEFAIKSFDTVILNLCADGGLAGQEGVDVGGIVDELIDMRLHKPEMSLRWLLLVTDQDFCESERFRSLRERLVFYSFVDSISLIRDGDATRAVVYLDLEGGFFEVAFEEVIPSPRPSLEKDGLSDPFGFYGRRKAAEPQSNKVSSFGVPYSIVIRKGCSFLPESYLEEEKEGMREYSVAYVGPPLSDGDRKILGDNGILVSTETDSVNGPEGLLEQLKRDSERALRSIHAVIMDITTDFDERNPFKYTGVVDVILANPDIPVFIYSDRPMDTLGEGLKCLLESKKDTIILVPGKPSSVDILVSRIRTHLDALPSVDAAILAKYHDEIKAAEDIDPSGEITRMLAKVLKREVGGSGSVKHSQDLLNGLRICAETLFKSEVAKAILPPLNSLGEFKHFLMDGEYYDKNKRALYVQTPPELMPDALKVSFGFFVDMTNAGSHKSDERNVDVIGYMSKTGRPAIYNACSAILLDLLCWLPAAYLRNPHEHYVKMNLIEGWDSVMKVKCRDYFYIGKVHLLPKPGLREGIPASCIRLKTASLDQFRINDKKTEGVRYYAKPSDYDIIE